MNRFSYMYIGTRRIIEGFSVESVLFVADIQSAAASVSG